MHHAAPMSERERVEDRIEDLAELARRRQDALGAPPPDLFVEREAVEHLEHDPRDARSRALEQTDVVHANDRRVRQREEDAGLPQVLVGPEHFGLHELHRDRRAEHEMRTGVDHAESALPDEPLDAKLLREDDAYDSERIAHVTEISSASRSEDRLVEVNRPVRQ